MTALLDARAVEVLGSVLLHSLWQGLVVAVAAAFVLAFVQRAAARYRIACLGLLVFLAWPALTAVGLALNDSPATIIAAEAASAEATPGVEDAPGATQAAPEGAGVPVEGERPGVRFEPSAAEPAPAPLDELRARWGPSLVVLWCSGVLAGLVRLTLGLAIVARLRRSGRPAEPAVVEAAKRIAADVGLRARVVVLETRRLAAPVVVGVVRPVLLLPLGLAASLPPAQLEAVLAHELAHVLRRDYLANLLQRLAETLLFHHPAAWWLSNVVRTEREHLCDDAAVRAVGGDPLPLARALATLERGRDGAPVAAMGARGSRGAPGDLLGRVRRLLGRDAARQRPPLAPLAWRAALPALLLGALAVFAPAVAQVGQESSGVRWDGRYGVLVLADGTREAYVRVERPGGGEGVAPRLVAPDGERLPGSDLRATPEAWSVHAPFELAEPLLAELEEDRVELPLEDPVRLEPPRPGIDLGTSPTPLYGEDGRVVGWNEGAVPRLVWEPVPDAAAYHVEVNERRTPDGTRIFPADDRFVLGEGATSFTMGGLAPGVYFVRVRAFSAPPRTSEGEGLRRVDEAVSETLTFHWHPVRRRGTDVAPPAGDESDPARPTGGPAITAEWVEDRLVVQLPSREGIETWNVDLRPRRPDEAHAPSLGTSLPGVRTRVQLARAEEIPPGVPYLLEVRGLANVPEGTPVDEAPALATRFVGPIERPEPAGDEPLARVRLGRYAGPNDLAGLRLELEGSYLLEEGDEVVLLAPDGEPIDRHLLDPGSVVRTEAPWAGAGAYRARVERAGETIEEHVVTLPAREPLPRPVGLRFEAAPASTPGAVPAAAPGVLSWNAVEGADRYLVEVDLSPSMSRGWWADRARVDLADVLEDAAAGAYEVQVTAYRSEAERHEAAGIRDASASDRVSFELVGEDVHEPELLPFHLRYGHYVGDDGGPRLYLRLDLAPDGGSSVGPATVRILAATGEVLATVGVSGSAWAGDVDVDPAAVAALEVTNDADVWTIPVEIGAAPEGFEPVSEWRTEHGDEPGGTELAWDPVAGAVVYEVGFFPRDGGSGKLVSAAEPRVPLAFLAPGTYDARVRAYSRDPDAPGPILPVDVAVPEARTELVVDDLPVEPEPGGVDGVVRVGDEPIAGASVGLFPLRDGTFSRSDQRLASTDEDGRFAFADVPPGRYGASVESAGPFGPGALPLPVPFTTIAVAAGATTTAPDLYAVPPIEPRGVLASGTATPGEVTLSWEPVSGAASYQVVLRERTRSSDGAASVVLTSGTVDAPEWTARLEGGRVHEVVVEAHDDDGIRIGRLGVFLRTVP